MVEPYTPMHGDSTVAALDLQGRLTRLSRTLFIIAAGMLGFRIATAWTGRWTPSHTVHVVAALMLLVVWRWCQGKPMSARVLEGSDVAVTIVVCALWALLGFGISAEDPVEIPILLAVTHTLIARSAMVPSAFGRTLWISIIAILPAIVVVSVRGSPFLARASAMRVHTYILFLSVWLLVAAISAALNSRLIFGLRAQVREAARLGQYTLREKIGEGGMGAVYRATHSLLRRPAAIKLLLPERGGQEDLARFEREVQLTSRLAHPNTISIFDYGRTDSGVFYYVMEYLRGFDLEKLVEGDGPLAPARVIRILQQMCGSLCEAHALGLIHRDIKPANVVLTERADEPDVVKVVDFGLVKTLERAAGDAGITNVGGITGTPMYLAPEALTSPETVDARSDLYAVGAVGYFLLTAQHVFDAPTIVEVCSKHLLEAPVPPSQRLGRSVPPDLEAIILACLAKREWIDRSRPERCACRSWGVSMRQSTM